jgi:uncharacterized membrane-anchored protein
MFAQTLKLGYFLSTIALVAILIATVAVQLRSDRYNPFYYWTVILTTTMAGTRLSRLPWNFRGGDPVISERLRA